MEEQKKILFKIPNISGKQVGTKVIGIIDSSGSMSSWWKDLANTWNQCVPADQIFVTITFDTQTYQKGNNLSTQINDHGGGGTDIPKAFIKFEEEIQKVPENESVTAIFISDGQDNHLSTLEKRLSELKGNYGRKVNFICLGVEKGFPTFLSMRLRTLYHSGDEGIPALYLIEYASEKAFLNKFETINQYFQAAQTVDVIPPCRKYPWEEPISELHEGTFVITEENFVVINDTKIEIDEKKIKIDDIIDATRNWLQKLHLINLEDPKAAKQYAEITLKEVKQQCEWYKIGNKIDLLLEHNTIPKTFSERALANFMKHTGQRVRWFVEEIKSIIKGEELKQQNEFEAAKKIQLGTIVGKQQQKVLQLKQFTNEDFVSMKKDFEDVYKTIQINELSSSQGKEHVHKINQLDTFQDKELLKGLEYCKTIYTLIETFPVIGNAFLLKKTDGFQENPYKIVLKAIPKHYKIIDSTQVIESDMLLKLKVPGSEEEEEINAIIPLFNENDKHFIPLIKTKLYKYLISYMVTLNADTYFDEAYLSLLSSLFTYIIDANNFAEQFSAEHQELIDKIFATFKLVYGDDPQSIQFSKDLFEGKNVFVQGKDIVPFGKILLHFFYAWKQQSYDKETQKKIFKRIMIEWFGRFSSKIKYEISKFFITEYDKTIYEKVKEHFEQNLNKIENVAYFNKKFQEDSNKIILTEKQQVKISESQLYKQLMKFDLLLLEKLYVFFFQEKIDKNCYYSFIFHANKYKENRMEQPFVDIVEKAEIMKELQNQNVQIIQEKDEQILLLQNEFRNKFVKEFAENHFDVIPLKKEVLEQKLKEHNIDISKVTFNTYSSLPENICMSTKCPFYLQQLPEGLYKHLGSWVGLMPRSFHTIVKENKDKTSEEIYKIFSTKKGFKPEKYKVEKEFVLKYIEKVQLGYQ